MRKEKSNWYAGVTNGAEAIISEMLPNDVSNIRRLESAVLFSYGRKLNHICFHQLFYVLREFNSKSLQSAAGTLVKQSFLWNLPKQQNTFRIIIMENGKLRPLQPFAMNSLEKMVIAQTKLSLNRAKPDLEIWLNRHNTGRTFFMVRMSKDAPYDKKLIKGELRPDIAAIMCHLSKVKKDGVLCDPFGGSGAIAHYASKNKICKSIITGDISQSCIDYMTKRLSGLTCCDIRLWDAFYLPLGDESIDAIVTDPPWGEFQKLPVTDFYKTLTGNFKRVLKKGGSIVMLTSATTEAKEAFRINGFSKCHASQIFVNGKKASIFTAVK